MTFPQWGDVPSWLAAGSLLLAFRIFLRDRATNDRAQVDKVAVWGKIKRNPSLPGGPRIDDVEVQLCMRNATDLPVEVHQVAWNLKTEWLVAVDGIMPPIVPVRSSEHGKPDVLRFNGAVGLAPQDSWESMWFPINLTHTAPADDALLSMFSEGVKFVIHYALIADNSGRRWMARQSEGKLAKRMRWYSRPGEYHPLDWQSPIWRKYQRFMSKARKWIHRVQ